MTTKTQIDALWNAGTDERLSWGAVEVVRGRVVNRYFYTDTDNLGRREYIDYSPADGKGQGFFRVPTALPGGAS